MTLTGLHGSCTTPPCAASLLGDVGLTTATGTDRRTGAYFGVGENIYGPFENGFGSPQDFLLERLGCSPGSLGHLVGGIVRATSAPRARSSLFPSPRVLPLMALSAVTLVVCKSPLAGHAHR
jgi:hypothetical protein